MHRGFVGGTVAGDAAGGFGGSFLFGLAAEGKTGLGGLLCEGGEIPRGNKDEREAKEKRRK